MHALKDDTRSLMAQLRKLVQHLFANHDWVFIYVVLAPWSVGLNGVDPPIIDQSAL